MSSPEPAGGRDTFQFNFFAKRPVSDVVSATKKYSVEVAQEIVPSPQDLQMIDDDLRVEDVEITSSLHLSKGTITSSSVASLMDDCQLKDSDLVPGKYEGGFKLWEGSLDLCRYLIDTYDIKLTAADNVSGGSELQNKCVLELGCGHGLPGIVALAAGAEVHFQDFNGQVLTQLTAPNVRRNLASLPHKSNARRGPRYFSGDWESVGMLMSTSGLGGYYDLILTAETIYNEDSHWALLQCCKQVLKPPHGRVLVAAKTYYFGVGGGTASFARTVEEDGVLECTSVWSAEDGTSNKREVLMLKFPDAIIPYFL